MKTVGKTLMILCVVGLLTSCKASEQVPVNSDSKPDAAKKVDNMAPAPEPF